MIDRLRTLPGFATLDENVLRTILDRASVRSFEPGQLVLSAGEVAGTLFAILAGSLIADDGHAAPPVFDAPGLLFGLAVREDHRAGPDGLKTIVIAKPHVFTIAREFPEFIVSLMEEMPDRFDGDRGGPDAAGNDRAGHDRT